MISASTQELQDSHIAKYLQLLPDFVADMRIVAMKLSQMVSFCLAIGQHKTGFVKGSDYVENVQGPGFALYRQILNWGKVAIRTPDTPAGQWFSVGQHGNFGVCGNLRQKNVATYPSGTPSCQG